jgi:hypothetical protein
MRPTFRAVTVAISAMSIVSLGLAFAVTDVSATATIPANISLIVSPTTVNDPGCPDALSTLSPAAPVYNDLASAVAAATTGETIYVCAGTYNMSAPAYNSNAVDITQQGLIIDGYNWNVAPSSSDTASSVDPSTQSVFENGSGLLIQASGVTISGLTFYENNDQASNVSDCNAAPCGSSIDVQTLVSGAAGDQGEPNVTINNNLFANTGGTSTDQNGVIHFGLGQDASSSEPTSDVNALDSGDVVEDNVFAYNASFENNALQMSDTTGGLVTENTVNYPSVDDNALSALWFPGFDQATTISYNTLNGGGIDSDSPSSAVTSDPKSGIKIIDRDSGGNYGNGCSNQNITHNTISGFVYDISLISTAYNVNSLCPVGPTDFSVTDNTVSNALVYGIYVSGGATGGTLTGNVASDTDAQGFTPDGYSAGEFDFFDGNSSGSTWANNTGNGSASPSGIGELPTPTTTTTTTTIGSPPPPPPVTTPTSPPVSPPGPPVTTTTIPPKPTVTILATKSSGGKVVVAVRCAISKCSGLLELTKSISSKSHTTIELLGKTSYAEASGTRGSFSITLNAAGLKLIDGAHHLTCVLTFTSRAGTKHEPLTLIVA